MTQAPIRRQIVREKRYLWVRRYNRCRSSSFLTLGVTLTRTDSGPSHRSAIGFFSSICHSPPLTPVTGRGRHPDLAWAPRSYGEGCGPLVRGSSATRCSVTQGSFIWCLSCDHWGWLVAVFSTGSPDLMGRLDAVIGATEEFLELTVSGDHSADTLGAIRQYYIESDVFAAGISTAIATDTDRFSSTGGRARLFGAAVSDLLVFRCIGMVDYWAAVNESGAITAADDLSRFRGDLLADLRAARSAFDQPGGPVVAGGAANSLEVFAKKQVHDIADESASNVLGAALDFFGGVIPGGTSRTVIRGAASHRPGPPPRSPPRLGTADTGFGAQQTSPGLRTGIRRDRRTS
jgi:hypothetical protein